MKSDKFIIILRFFLLLIFIISTMLLLLTACSSPVKETIPVETTSDVVEVNPMFSNPSEVETNDDIDPTDEPVIAPEVTPIDPNFSGVAIDLAGETKPFNSMLLGTNVPAWLGKDRLTEETFLKRTKASGVSMLRIPGGSWANYYEWLPCERQNICPWDWGVMTPTDFVNLINATGLEAMYTVNMNTTAKEAAALVAFFNGSVGDETVIGVDVWGRDWGTVNDWARLRSENGNPEPVTMTYWEIGNEIYGGRPDMGTGCTYQWGWEDVWTCDGKEYVTGIGQGEERKEGFLEYVAAMKAVDPSILIGAVGVSPQDDWGNWGYEIIAEAGDVLDFYVIHEYGFFGSPDNLSEILAKPQTVWGPMMANVQEGFNRFGNSRSAPVAITEFNLFSDQNRDNDQLMTRAVNMLFIADSIGQMATHGFAIANQWNLVNGQGENGTDYGLLHADTFVRYPQYYVFPLWSKFGSELLPVNSPFSSENTLSVYASKHDDGTVTLLAINKTNEPITSEIQIFNGPESFSSGVVDVVQAPSLDSQQVSWNGVVNPASDFSDAPPTKLETIENPGAYTFEPLSITLIQFLP